MSHEQPTIQSPRSFVLGYLAGRDSPTSVGGVASTAMLIQGVLFLCIALLLGYFVWRVLVTKTEWNDWTYIFGGSLPSARYYWTYYTSVRFGSPSRWEVFVDLMRLLWLRTPTIPALIAFVPGLMSLMQTGGVKHGKRSSCLACMFPVVLSMIICIVAAATAGVIAVLSTFKSFPEFHHPMYNLLWIALVAAGLLACLCIDLIGYLKWISRRNSGEKPAKKFM